jgi:hypothetical protein
MFDHVRHRRRFSRPAESMTAGVAVSQRNTCLRARRAAVVLSLPAALGLSLLSAPAASATPGPIVQPSAAIVTANALPTAQIEGVAWTQVIVRNTVYVGGSFAWARPAGAAAGTQRVRRYNLLSYNLTTGVINAGFAPVLNGQVRALSVSPDGLRLYVGGDFTIVNRVSHQHLVAFGITSGALVSTFRPTINGIVEALAATNTSVYAGGAFTEVNGTLRTRLALLAKDTAKLANWAPTANSDVRALLVAPNRSRLIVGGAFTLVDGQLASGLAAVSLGSGAKFPFAVGNVVKLGSRYSGITSLSTDGTSIYGTGYVYHATVRNLEGTFSADQNTGAVNWIEDCHGDTYSAYPGAAAVYVVGHAHDCARVGGYPQDATVYHRALAFTKNATGQLATNTAAGYANFGGTRSPSLMNWFPDLTPGKFTGQGQAAWSIAGNAQYLTLAGEFLAVNGVPQQGLVRFAIKPISDQAIAAGQSAAQLPMVTGTELIPAVDYQVSSSGAVSTTLSWLADWARDSEYFSYTLTRWDDGASVGKVVYQTNGISQFWNRPQLQFTDTDQVADVQYRYRLTVADASGAVIGDSALAPPS